MLEALFGDMAADLALDAASTGLLGPWVVQRTREWLEDDAGNTKSWLDTISGLTACLDWRLGRQQLWICLTWQQRHLLGHKTCTVRQVIPLWTGCKQPEDSSGEGSPSLWQLDNFTRGQAFRSLLGGTLPYDFPVIAAFEQGEATAIKSVDLTRPTYQAAAAFETQIGSCLDSLAAFQGRTTTRAAGPFASGPGRSRPGGFCW